MQVWELDPAGDDFYVEKMTFPNCSVTLDCSYGSCDAEISEWKNPTGGDKDRLYAKIRLKVYGGDLVWLYP